MRREIKIVRIIFLEGIHILHFPKGEWIMDTLSKDTTPVKFRQLQIPDKIQQSAGADEKSWL